VVDVGDRASDTEGKGMQMNFSTWLHVRLGTLEIPSTSISSTNLSPPSSSKLATFGTNTELSKSISAELL
jgi:hypothetical protein